MVNFDLLHDSRIIAQMNTPTEPSDWQQVGIRQFLRPQQIAKFNQRRDLPGVVFFLGAEMALLTFLGAFLPAMASPPSLIMMDAPVDDSMRTNVGLLLFGMDVVASKPSIRLYQSAERLTSFTRKYGSMNDTLGRGAGSTARRSARSE